MSREPSAAARLSTAPPTREPNPVSGTQRIAQPATHEATADRVTRQMPVAESESVLRAAFPAPSSAATPTPLRSAREMTSAFILSAALTGMCAAASLLIYAAVFP